VLAGVFTEFSVTLGQDPDGTDSMLRFQLSEGYNGNLTVHVQVIDDGGGVGENSSLVPFSLHVTPVNSAPELSGNGAQWFRCEWNNFSYPVGSLPSH
jgi:hypothetical protein